MNNITEAIVSILAAVVGVAILAVLVSRNSQTSSVIGAGGEAFSRVLGTALSPVTGFSGGQAPYSGFGGLSSPLYPHSLSPMQLN